MKYTAILFFALLLCLSACSDNSDNNKSSKKVDRPNLDNVSPTSKAEKKAANVNRKPSTPKQLEKANAIIAAASESAIAGVNAKQLFKNYCAICHGTTGNLNVNGATDLTASILSLEERVAQVYHGRGLMTPFKGLLKDHEIMAVTKYIEELR
ncbi:MAG: mono/diheme cytochrome c family protein [Patescibacteria group bacterium]|jgi:mono/diheme cytochrome c family protein